MKYNLNEHTITLYLILLIFLEKYDLKNNLTIGSVAKLNL